MKQKAFTLTELLVVVVIVGVLAAVVLPKFTKAVEMRKISEAQEMMSAVRGEQEARCTLGKNYIALDQLQVFRQGKNFTYDSNPQGVGIIARPTSEAYTLEIPSYADGRICCSKGCADINRSFPTCSELQAQADYVQPNKQCEWWDGIPPVEPQADCTPSASYSIIGEGEASSLAANAPLCDSNWETRTSAYQCPSNLTEKKTCYDIYLDSDKVRFIAKTMATGYVTGDFYASTYNWAQVTIDYQAFANVSINKWVQKNDETGMEEFCEKLFQDGATGNIGVYKTAQVFADVGGAPQYNVTPLGWCTNGRTFYRAQLTCCP